MSFRVNNITVFDSNANFSVPEVVFRNGTGVVVYPDAFFFTFQGTTSGYVSGGLRPEVSNVIDKFPFATNANATDVGDLTLVRYFVAGQSSSTHGFTTGGYPNAGYPATNNIIDRFPFASNANAVDSGDLSLRRYNAAGVSSETHGYTVGGFYSGFDVIDRFPFASYGNATDVGDLSQPNAYQTGISSSFFGYSVAGQPQSNARNTIERFPFATNSNAVEVGNVTNRASDPAGQSGPTHGYRSGGSEAVYSPTFQSFFYNTIDKFPYASNGTATDVGDLTAGRYNQRGQSSTVSGYTCGGLIPPQTNIIDKFPFATDANAADVGDMSTPTMRLGAPQQK